jgi:hypothetical protein
MTKWFVTVDKYSDHIDEPEARVWTVSKDPNNDGWETDGGYPGYGLPKKDAEELANAANRIEKLEATLREIIGTLNDPRGGQHVYDMRNASYIARKALEWKNG